MLFYFKNIAGLYYVFLLKKIYSKAYTQKYYQMMWQIMDFVTFCVKGFWNLGLVDGRYHPNTKLIISFWRSIF
jgi:hypothetical protein